MTSDQKQVRKRWLMAIAAGVISGLFAGFMFSNFGIGLGVALIATAIFLLATSPPPPELQ